MNERISNKSSNQLNTLVNGIHKSNGIKFGDELISCVSAIKIFEF